MSCHRRFVLFAFPFGLITTITITLAIPIYDVSDKSIRLSGILSLLDNGNTAPILTSLILVCTYILSDIQLIMLINRYDFVSKKILKPSRWTFRGIYFIIALSNIFQSTLSTTSCFHHAIPFGITTNYRWIDSAFKPLYLMYYITRVIAFLYIIHLNIDFRKVLEIRSMPNVIRFHKMVLRAIIANVIVQLLFTQLPILVAMAAFSSYNVSLTQMFVNFGVCSFNCTFLGCMLATLYFVKPYRKFVVSLFGSINNVMPVEMSVSAYNATF
uniref:G protein-coupled receptor n=1 Tax=Panagrellus redivivus TaxID=6233 RepID=A0A7E4V0L6_PANRE